MLYLFRDAVENGLKELLVVFGLDGAHQGLVPPLLADLVVPFLVVNEVVDVGMGHCRLLEKRVHELDCGHFLQRGVRDL